MVRVYDMREEKLPDGPKPGFKRTPFVCKSDRALVALKFWLRDCEPFNAFNAEDVDAVGNPIIKIGLETSGPEGNRWFPVDLIVCSTDELRSSAVEEIERTLLRREAAP